MQQLDNLKRRPPNGHRPLINQCAAAQAILTGTAAGAARPISASGFKSAVAALAVPPAVVWAILNVESTGCGYLPDGRLQLLFERHHFHRYTNGRFAAAIPHLSNPTPGGYGAAGAHQWARFTEAARYNGHDALLSTSWGLPQIMGSNARSAGFPDAAAMVQQFAHSENAQLSALAKFITADTDMQQAAQSRTWASFARRYNGPDYAANQYDKRLAGAYARAKAAAPDLGIRTMQMALMFLGFNPGPIDGYTGRKTQGAKADFMDWAADNNLNTLNPATLIWPPQPDTPRFIPMERVVTIPDDTHNAALILEVFQREKEDEQHPPPVHILTDVRPGQTYIMRVSSIA